MPTYPFFSSAEKSAENGGKIGKILKIFLDFFYFV